MKYIATREGVEKLHGRGPVTPPQKELIAKILTDYPDAKELFEYGDYCGRPTFANASAFIAMALDANAHTIEAGDGYLKYIATRPRAERRGDHGLFSTRYVVSLKDTMEEVAAHPGPVWTIILSLRREDASALGYDSADRWRTLLLQHQTKLAQAMKIPANDFRWCAAYHDEGYHPHVHMMVWSADPKRGYLTKAGISAMRSALTNTIFQEEMHNLYEKKDLAYRELVRQARSAMEALVTRMESAPLEDAAISEKMVELAQALGGVSGKKQYGYLPKKFKALVDATTDALASQRTWPPAIRCGMIFGMSWSGSTRTSPAYTAPSLSRRSSRRSKIASSARRNDCVRSWSRTGPCRRTPRNMPKRTATLRSFPSPPLTRPASPPHHPLRAATGTRRS